MYVSRVFGVVTVRAYMISLSYVEKHTYKHNKQDINGGLFSIILACVG